jgi:hypothetical protein
MTKRAISITLDAENLLWLRAQTRLRGARSVSETVDTLIREARAARSSSAASIRSVVGTIRIAASDPDLAGADQEIGEMFKASLERELPTGAKKPMRRPRRRATRG